MISGCGQRRPVAVAFCVFEIFDANLE